MMALMLQLIILFRSSLASIHQHCQRTILSKLYTSSSLPRCR